MKIKVFICCFLLCCMTSVSAFASPSLLSISSSEFSGLTFSELVELLNTKTQSELIDIAIFQKSGRYFIATTEVLYRTNADGVFTYYSSSVSDISYYSNNIFTPFHVTGNRVGDLTHFGIYGVSEETSPIPSPSPEPSASPTSSPDSPGISSEVSAQIKVIYLFAIFIGSYLCLKGGFAK